MNKTSAKFQKDQTKIVGGVVLTYKALHNLTPTSPVRKYKQVDRLKMGQ